MTRYSFWATNITSDAGMREIIPSHDLCLTHIAINHGSANVLERTSLILTVPPNTPGMEYLKVTLGTFQVAHCEQLSVNIRLNKGIKYSLQAVGLNTLSVMGYYTEEPQTSAPVEVSQPRHNADSIPRTPGGSPMLAFARSTSDAPRIMVVPPEDNLNHGTGSDQPAPPPNGSDSFHPSGTPVISAPLVLDPEYKFDFHGPDIHERSSGIPPLPQSNYYMPPFDKEEPARPPKKKKLNAGAVASGKKSKEKKGKDLKEKRARSTKAKGKEMAVETGEDEGSIAAGPSGLHAALYEA
ncbi:hypothetical protein FB446DRAFT_789157 [Lentinula raphanica]|nr:hypothetical protein FB446DRAFT_789157 [Lentinula raphanica]